MHPHGSKFSLPPDMQSKLLQTDDNLMLIRISLHLCNQTAGIDHIDGKYAKEKANHKGKG